MRRVKRGGGNWKERVVGNVAGDERVFIPGRGSEWQMRPAQRGQYRRRRGGEGGHGAAEPHAVIHRYLFYRIWDMVISSVVR